MIRTQFALLRHAQDFFNSDLVGLYRWDHVRIDPPEKRAPLIPTLSPQERRKQQESREGGGRFLEQERLRFGPWEILLYSAQERGPLGEVTLRDFETAQVLVTGPLDPATWKKIGERIRTSHQRKAS